MKKRYAIITDIHGNIEGLNAILNDIESRNIDDIFCLGDAVGIGPNSKECIDRIIELNIKTILGNHELYILRGTDIDLSIEGQEKEHYNWIRNSLNDYQMDFLNKLPLYYKLEIDYDGKIPNKEIILCHFLLNDEKQMYPFEKENLKKDINLWVKYNSPNIFYVVGHLHKHFNINDVEGIFGDIIESIGELPNIEVVDSAGCSYDEYVSYSILEIDKSIKFERINVKFDRTKFTDKLKNIDFPDKKNIMKYFFGIND